MTDTLITETVKLDRLFPNPSNPRFNDEAVPHVAASLQRFGWQQPVVAKLSGEIIAGHTRFLAAQSLSMQEIPVVWFEGDDLEAVAFGIADNRTGEFASWDDEALAKLLSELRDEDALDGVGYDDKEIDALLHSVLEESDLEDPGAEEPPENPVTKEGDLWLLGKHRLLCGDATNERDVETLFAGKRPGLMVTDPPYGVSYRPEWRQEAGLADGGKTAEVANDERVDWTDAWRLFPGEVAYVWHAGVHSPSVGQQLQDVGFDIRSQIIWAKNRFAISRGHYHWQHEPCFYVVRSSATASWGGDHAQCTLWPIAQDKADQTEHSTQKPLECMLRPLRNHDIHDVYDPFLGSGTTMIAAEKLNRRCFGLELTPRFCDVIISRWEKATGQEAILEASNESFLITAERRAD
ncbi:MAG: DNA modification methylase [Planctomycetota bacterium]